MDRSRPRSTHHSLLCKQNQEQGWLQTTWLHSDQLLFSSSSVIQWALSGRFYLQDNWFQAHEGDPGQNNNPQSNKIIFLNKAVHETNILTGKTLRHNSYLKLLSCFITFNTLRQAIKEVNHGFLKYRRVNRKEQFPNNFKASADLLFSLKMTRNYLKLKT